MGELKVEVRCIACGHMRVVGPGEVEADSVPFCDRCYSVMVPVRAVGKERP